MALQGRYERIEALIGTSGLEKLKEARVLVAGLGGVGGACAISLARGGIGTLAIVDCDEVEASNLNRQAITFTDTIGMRKTDAAQKLMERIDPDMHVIPIDARISPDTIEAIFDSTGDVDYIVDAIDDAPAKIALALWAKEREIPLVSCMGTARKLHPERLEFADLFETHDCPLCRSMRSRCRKAGIERLTVLFSPEVPFGPDGPVLGTTSFTPPIAGEMLAGYVIRALLGIDED
ncbi:MAG: ThiF family adenylyltransferase [Eggerthellaceae bacterium]|nr:ThiF family adenylyltransferase [Eggerthellaceae bacterium]